MESLSKERAVASRSTDWAHDFGLQCTIKCEASRHAIPVRVVWAAAQQRQARLERPMISTAIDCLQRVVDDTRSLSKIQINRR